MGQWVTPMTQSPPSARPLPAGTPGPTFQLPPAPGRADRTGCPGTTSRRSSAKSACARPASAWRWAGSCSPRATATSPPKCSTRKPPAPKCRCRWRPSTTPCTNSPKWACCARSPSTVQRPISTLTIPSTTTSSSKTRTISWTSRRTKFSSARRRWRRRVMRSRGSMWWYGCGGRSRADGKTSFDLLVRINAPQLVLLDPAVKNVAGDLAPFAGAVFDRAQHADLQLRRDRALSVGFGIDRRQVGLRFQLHGRGALARQQRVIDPALAAVGIADAAPVLELGGDFDRQADLRVDPGDVVVLVRAAAHIDPIGLEADEARHR